MGYEYWDSKILFGVGQGCAPGGVAFEPAAVPGTPPTALSEESVTLDLVRGMELWVDGVHVAANADTSTLTYAAGGSIGRASFVATDFGTDPRFRGDIAEVVIYDTALDDPDRIAIEKYLGARWGY
jgi:hypothetical protein